MRLRVGACSDVGRQRAENQDYALYRIVSDQPDANASCSLFLVADGVGGAAGGATASELAARTLAGHFPRDGGPDPTQTLASAILVANTAVSERAAAEPALHGMGTTVVVAVVRDDQFWMANAGDSRGYLIRDGRARQVTNDHSLVAEHVRQGGLTEAQAAVSPYRHVITRSLGHDGPLDVEGYGPEPLRVGDQLLLCSDGLTEVLDAPEIATLAGEHDDPDAAARALVAEANDRGGPDNITVVMVRVLA